ncbi:hypothetical protein [Vibrio parahaemolyticus]|uniref:hypothetical protein n=1 Tax=Vibrio parahaemolyticus TaxID=670 RepID=UPI00226B7E56|nr:hypothetical protein [Vibrio parahaemolyticus]MCX8941258.1 hypothetical protein [Vibrio parahaemolyticus]
MRSVLIVAAVLASASVSAMSMPLGKQSSGYDRVRAADGTECQVSTQTRTTLTLGAFGSQSNNDDSTYSNTYSHRNGGNDESGLYAGIVIALPDGNPVNRIDCSGLYQRELARKDLELDRLRAEVDMLKRGTHQFSG